jgi:hypothetical protein
MITAPVRRDDILSFSPLSPHGGRPGAPPASIRLPRSAGTDARGDLGERYAVTALTWTSALYWSPPAWNTRLRMGRGDSLGAVSSSRLLAVLASLASVGLTQSADGQRRVFRDTANLVLVDVYPHRDGRIVEGLTRDDFEVFEDSVPQAVEGFTRPAPVRTSSSVPSWTCSTGSSRPTTSSAS